MPDLVAQMAEINRQIGEVSKLALPKSEADERFTKLEANVETVMKALQDDVVRKTDAAPRAAGTGAAEWLFKHGYRDLPRPMGRQDLKHGKGLVRPISSVNIYKTDPYTLQTTNELAVPQEVKDALEVMDHLYIINKLLEFSSERGDQWRRDKASHEHGTRGLMLDRFPELAIEYDGFVKEFLALQGKALDSTTAGGADEWVPTIMATNLLDIIRLSMPVTNLIPHRFQPSNPWQNPLLSTVPKAYRKLENTNITESNLTSANLTWTAHIFAVYSAFSDELDDDSAVAIAPTVRSAIVRAMGEGLENALVNGDGDAAGHFDDDYQYSSGAYETYQGGVYGLRHFAMDDSGGTPSTYDCGAGAISYADIGSALAIMGKFGAQRIAAGEVVALVTAQQYIQLVTEASSPIQTLEKYGSGATILSGELGRIFGVPIFVSHGVEQRKDSVAATGQNTMAGPNTLSTALVFNRLNWVIGDRRDFRLERDKDIIAGRNDVVATARYSMQSIEGDNEGAGWDPSTVPAIVALVNVD